MRLEDPTVGSIVHFRSRARQTVFDLKKPLECHAAIVTAISEQTGFGRLVSLCVFHPSSGMSFYSGIEHDELEKYPLSWHWPAPECDSEETDEA